MVVGIPLFHGLLLPYISFGTQGNLCLIKNQRTWEGGIQRVVCARVAV